MARLRGAARLGWFGWGLATAAAVALAVRVAYVVVVDPQVLDPSDATSYHLLANHLADGHGYVRPYDFEDGRSIATAEFPPLFPSLVAVVAFLGGEGVTVQRLAVAPLGALTVVLVGLLGRRVAGPVVGLLAAAVAAVHPMLVQPDGTLMAESLFAPLVVGAVLLACRALDGDAVRRWAGLGVVVGLAALTRGEGWLLGPLLAVPAAVATARRAGARAGWRAAGVALGAAVLVVAPWTVRNAVRLDAFVPVSTNLGGAVGGANCDRVYVGYQEGLWRIECNDAAARPGLGEAAQARHLARAGATYALDHLDRVPRVAAIRWLRTWGLFRPGQQADYATLEGRNRDWEGAGLALDWALMPLAVAGAVVVRRRARAGGAPVWPLLAPVVMASVVAVATYGNPRFRVAAEPVLAVLAATAVAALPVRRIGRR